MPENYIAMFNAPGEEESRAIVAKAKPVLEQGCELIRQGKDLPAPKVGFLDKLKSGPINEGFYKFYVKADAFVVTDACISCGACVEACPLNNIRLSDGKPVWDKHCTHCMACICGCPTEAIEYGKRSRGKPRYQCPKDETL
jgi:MinD superfamily P-loop ATPase